MSITLPDGMTRQGTVGRGTYTIALYTSTKDNTAVLYTGKSFYFTEDDATEITRKESDLEVVHWDRYTIRIQSPKADFGGSRSQVRRSMVWLRALAAEVSRQARSHGKNLAG